MTYKEALAASFARMYRASQDVIDREGVDIARRFPIETRADYELQLWTLPLLQSRRLKGVT